MTVKTFIDRPILSGVISVAIIIVGLMFVVPVLFIVLQTIQERFPTRKSN